MRKILFTLTAILIITCLIQPLAQVSGGNPLSYYDIYFESPKEASYYTYQNSTVELSIYVGIPQNYPKIAFASYSLDGDINRTLIGSEVSTYNYHAEGSLVNLTEGLHTVTVYATNVYGLEISEERTFKVDSTYKYLAVTIISPLNQTYSKNEVPLTYTVNKKILSARYFLDYSPMNDFNGNITLTKLSDGPHKIYISINTENGYSSNITYFNINTTKSENGSTLEQTNTLAITVITIVAIILTAALLVYHKKQTHLNSNRKITH